VNGNDHSFSPDWWKSDRPSPEMSAKAVVALAPGKSVSLPFAINRVHYKTKESFALTGSYGVAEKEFAEKHRLGLGRVEAPPVEVKVIPSDEAPAIEALEKVGGNLIVDTTDAARPVVQAILQFDEIGDADLVHVR
jgi:hypothetical protein